MLTIDSFHRNDDGTYSSSSGQVVSQLPNGELYLGGVSTGYRDIGFGVQEVPSWADAGSSLPSGVTPPGSTPIVYAGVPVNVGGAVAYPLPRPATRFEARECLVPPMLLVYLWQLVVAALVYTAVSSPGKTPLGLHLHPAIGVAAAVAAAFVYIRLARFWPFALALTLASSAVAYLLAWGITRNGEARQAGLALERFEWGRLGTWSAWEQLGRILSPGFDRWTAAAVIVCALAHAAYWIHHRLHGRARRPAG